MNKIMDAQTCKLLKWDIAFALHGSLCSSGAIGDRTDAAGHPLHSGQDWSGQVLRLNRQQQWSFRADDQRRAESPSPPP